MNVLTVLKRKVHVGSFVFVSFFFFHDVGAGEIGRKITKQEKKKKKRRREIVVNSCTTKWNAGGCPGAIVGADSPGRSK